MVELCTCFTWKTHSFSANQKRTIFFRLIITTKTNNGIEKKPIQAKGTFCGVQQSCWQSVPSFPRLQPDDRHLLMKFSLSAEDCIKYFSWVTISQNFRYLTNLITKNRNGKGPTQYFRFLEQIKRFFYQTTSTRGLFYKLTAWLLEAIVSFSWFKLVSCWDNAAKQEIFHCFYRAFK